MNYNYVTHIVGSVADGLKSPVFFGTHAAIKNNGYPGTLITGATGSGKTNLAETLTALSAISGHTTVVIDFKGDFISLLRLDNQFGGRERISLQRLGDESFVGSLDPMLLGESEAQKMKYVRKFAEVVFKGGLSVEEGNALTNVMSDLFREAKAGEAPTMSDLRDKLMSVAGNPHAKKVGLQLKEISTLDSGKVCFSSSRYKKRRSIELSKGLTIVTMAGLNLPTGTADGLEERVASGIFYILSSYISDKLLYGPKDKPKLMVIDEAWKVLTTKPGRELITDIAQLGRSKNFAYILSTQNYSQLQGLQLESTISSHFAFKNEDVQADLAIEKMHLPSFHKSTLSRLNVGQCIMLDWKKSPAVVNINQWRDDWKVAFDTTPDESEEDINRNVARRWEVEEIKSKI